LIKCDNLSCRSYNLCIKLVCMLWSFQRILYFSAEKKIKFLTYNIFFIKKYYFIFKTFMYTVFLLIQTLIILYLQVKLAVYFDVKIRSIYFCGFLLYNKSLFISFSFFLSKIYFDVKLESSSWFYPSCKLLPKEEKEKLTAEYI
jgi:hypothetical protein